MLRKLPKTLLEFQRMFPDEEACYAYVMEHRWPQGFHCPHCGGVGATAVKDRPWLYECRACRSQVSLTAHTVMHATKLPLTHWFWGAYLAASHSNGISALQLKKQLGLGSYKSAWLMMAKLRRAMVDPDRTKLSGDVEVDEIFIKFRTKNDPPVDSRGRSPVGKMFIIVAVEIVHYKKDDEVKTTPGRIRIEPVPDTNKATLHGFIRRNIEPGSGIITDGNKAYRGLDDYFMKQTVTKDDPMSMFWTNRVASLIKTQALGTYHGYRRRYIRTYLDEFVFRFNRRKAQPVVFHTMLGLTVKTDPHQLRRIVDDPRDEKDKVIGLPNPAPGRMPGGMLGGLTERYYRKRGFFVREPDDYPE